MRAVFLCRIYFFQFAIQKYKIKDKQNYNFACRFVWVWNLVADTEGGTKAEGVWELVIEENNNGQKISIFFVSAMNMLLIYLFASMKLENGHKELLGSSFKIMLNYDILRNSLKYCTERWFK